MFGIAAHSVDVRPDIIRHYRGNKPMRMAEREGFEPSVPLLAVHTISSRAPSASSDISPQIDTLVVHNVTPDQETGIILKQVAAINLYYKLSKNPE
jgi:hypothetical protein